MKKNNKENLTGWLFIYNEYDDLWMCTTRENSRLLYNDCRNSKVLKSKSIDTLIALIIKMKGKLNEDYLNKL